MITGNKADIALSLRALEIVKIFLKEPCDVALAVLAEYCPALPCFGILIAEQNTLVS